jgi:hypothetical protein
MRQETNDLLVSLTEAVPAARLNDAGPTTVTDNELERFALRAQHLGTTTEPCIFTCGPFCH